MCHSHLVDIWALQSPNASSQSPAADYSQCRNVLAKLSTENLVEEGDGADDAWGTEDEEDEGDLKIPKHRSVGPLVATFKDIEGK